MINEYTYIPVKHQGVDDILVVKYTEKGAISVSCKPFDEPEGLRSPKQIAVEIVVADTGCGIEEVRLEKIFREFEQVESSEPRSNAEAGVGMLKCIWIMI